MSDLSLGHLAADFSQGAVPALLVFLKPVLHLSYTMTAAVVLVATTASSLGQPFFGHWSDRRQAVWMMPLGVGIGGAGIAAAAVAPNYAVLLVLVGLSGLGVGVFHPEAMKIAGDASGGRRASGMAFFATGGNIGFALGPVLASAAISLFGRSGGLLLAVPGAVVTGLLMREFGYLTHVRGGRAGHPDDPPAVDQPRAFRLLLVVIGLRSVAFYGLFTFVPLWEVSQGHTKSYGNVLLSLVLLAGVLGTLSAGPLADRLGRRLVLLASMLATPGLVVLYVIAGGAVGAVAVCLSGALIISTFGVTIVLSQEYLPSRIAMASGMSVGLAAGLGGVAAVALGAIADAIDLRTALILTAAAPAAGVLATLLLPADHGGAPRPAVAAQR